MHFGGRADDGGHSVQQTTDGGYVIVGRTSSFGNGRYDVYLVKTDALGEMTWSQTFGGKEYDDGQSVQQTTDGGYIISGWTDSFGRRVRGTYSSEEITIGDAYLIKADASGGMVWSKTFSRTSSVMGYSVQQTSDGGYIISCKVPSGSYLIKTNASGDLLWDKALDGISIEYGQSVRQTSDGGYVLVGFNLPSNIPLPTAPGSPALPQPPYKPGAIHLVKMDSSGIVTWNRDY